MASIVASHAAQALPLAYKVETVYNCSGGVPETIPIVLYK